MILMAVPAGSWSKTKGNKKKDDAKQLFRLSVRAGSLKAMFKLWNSNSEAHVKLCSIKYQSSIQSDLTASTHACPQLAQACMCMCVCACMCTVMHVYSHACACVCFYKCMHAQTCTRAFLPNVHVSEHTCTSTRAHMCAHADVCKCMHKTLLCGHSDK